MKIDTQPIRDLSGGITQKIGDELTPNNIVNFAQNLRFDKVIGRAVVRGGTALIGAQIVDAKSILGLHQFILSSGTKHLLTVCNVADDSNARIARYETDTWVVKTYDLTTSKKVRFLTYLDTVVALNGTDKFASEDGSVWIDDEEDTPTACTAALVEIAGLVTSGVHSYKVVYVNAVGETEAGAVSNEVTTIEATHGKVNLTSIPTGSADNCTSRKVYRTKAGGSIYYLLTTIADNSTTTYEDNIADASLGAVAPTTNTTGTALDLGNFPLAKYAVEWNDRVYAAGMTANSDRLQYTSTPTDYIVSWTGAGSGYIDIEPYEGQGTITGLGKVPGYLLIFKERTLKRWNGASTFPDDLCNLGTNSHESIVLGKRTAYFFSSGYAESIGFYETNGEETRKISRPIQGIVEAISSSNYSKVAGFSNGEMIMWSIGDITWESITYNNAVVMYHFDTQSWTLLTFPSEYRVFSPYIDASDNLKICAGDDNGQIIDVFKAATTTDTVTGAAGTAITYALQYHPMDLGSRSLMKEIAKIIPHTEDLTGAVLSYKIDKTGSYASFGTVTNNYTDEFTGRIAGHAFEFRWSGTATAGGEIIGFDIITPEVAMSIKY